MLGVGGAPITLADLPPQFHLTDRSPRIVTAPAAIRSNAVLLYDRMRDGGECFWNLVHGPFLARDLTRGTRSGSLYPGFQETRWS
jgi:hypothetical protein